MHPSTFDEAVKEREEKGILRGPGTPLRDHGASHEQTKPYDHTPEQLRKIEMEALFSKINADMDKQTEDKVRPKRLVDAQKDPKRAALVDSALRIVNLVREKAGLEALDDLPRAQPGDSGGCVLARAFGQGSAMGNPSVGGSEIQMVDEKMKEAAIELFGSTTLPSNFTLDTIVNEFDNQGLLAYDHNVPSPDGSPAGPDSDYDED